MHKTLSHIYSHFLGCFNINTLSLDNWASTSCVHNIKQVNTFVAQYTPSRLTGNTEDCEEMFMTIPFFLRLKKNH